MTIIKCKNCCKNFNVPHGRKLEAKFCSRKCYGLAMKNRIIKPMQYWLGKKRETKYWLGKKRSQETKEKISATRKGIPAWNKGKKYQQIYNKNNGMWMGDEVKYGALHSWIARKMGKPMICEFCQSIKQNTRQIHWANKSGKYLRDLSDWLRLCASCHRKYDSKNMIYYKFKS